MSSQYNNQSPGEQYEEPMYREHVSGPLHYPPQAQQPAHPGTPTRPYQATYGQPAPQGQQAYAQPVPQGQQPARPQPPQAQGNGWGPQHYQPYPQQPPMYAGYAQPQQGYPGYYPAYNGAGYYYPYYPYAWQAQKPQRDTYLFVMAIISTVCSGIVLLAGVICGFLLLFALLASTQASSNNNEGQLLGGIAILTALTIAGLIGGSFTLYHSIRSLMRRRSAALKMPHFWIFLLAYLVTLVIGFFVRGSSDIASNVPLTVIMIFLAGLFPALAILALAVRRVRSPAEAGWTTTWRRFTVSLVSGATSAIVFALILELILGIIVQAGLRLNSFNLSDPTQQIPDGPALLYFFLVLAVIAPVVEETVKPLAVTTLTGRINSAAEAFILGLATGIGFDLVETVGYISQGYSNWVDVALERSSAGLLHGFGAGMVALGVYYLSHGQSLKQHRILIGIGCILYAMLQHGIWNGSFVFALLPAPIGPALESGKFMIGSYPFQYILFIYIFWTILMVLFFLFVTGKLGNRPWLKPVRGLHNRNANVTQTQPIQERQYQQGQQPPVAAQAQPNWPGRAPQTPHNGQPQQGWQGEPVPVGQTRPPSGPGSHQQGPSPYGPPVTPQRQGLAETPQPINDEKTERQQPHNQA